MKTSGIHRIAASLAFLLLIPIGCDRDKTIRTYETAKEGPPTAQEPVTSSEQVGAPAIPASAPGDLRWTLPAGWKQVAQADTGGMFRSDAAIEVDPKDPKLVLTVSHLGDSPMARSVVANVNRWEGQLGLPPTPEADLGKVVTHVQVGDVPVDVVSLEGQAAAGRARLLGAIIAHGNETWFLKLSGPSDEVLAHKAEFDTFVRTIRFEQSGAEQTPSVAQGPGPVASPESANGAGGAKWTLPAGWNADPAPSPGSMRLATLHAGGNGAVEVRVSKFAGAAMGGGLLMNVNRWRGEVGLPPVQSEAQAQNGHDVNLGGKNWTIFDYSGTAAGGEPARRVVVATIVQNGERWYFKMAGPADAVEQQRADFDKFLASVQFANDHELKF